MKRILAVLLLAAMLFADFGMAFADDAFTDFYSVDGFADGLYFVTFMDGRQGCVNEKGNTVFVLKEGYSFVLGGYSSGTSTVGFPVKISVKTDIVENVYTYYDETFTTYKSAYGLVDKTGKIVCKAEYDSIAVYDSGIAVLKKGELYGYYNVKTGKVISKCQWEEAHPFADGMGRVRSKGKYGFVNTSGKLAVKCKWERANDFSEGLAVVNDGNAYGYIDTKGKTVAKCQFLSAHDMTCGLALVMNNNYLYGYINKKGKFLNEKTPYPYKYGESFQDNVARIGYYIQMKSYYRYIDKTGKVIFGEDGLTLDNRFQNGMGKITQGDKTGYINTKGKYVLQLKKRAYTIMTQDFGSYARIRDIQTGKYGFISKKDKVISKCQWDYAEAFSDGMACVKQNDRYGFINTKGKLVIPCKYLYSATFENGLAKIAIDKTVTDNRNGGEMSRKQILYGVINKNGKAVLPFEYTSVAVGSTTIAGVKDGELFLQAR